ncbi:MAG: TlpA disulfide reductase family protein [Chloroflexota bacterium]|nr:TlpA disulfide reductase family protein [Chloroflexota bacterium]
MSRRGWILLASGLPLLALFAVLAWASVRSGGNPGGFGVNAEFGQVEVSEDQADDFSLELMSGETLTLADLRGKAVMVDFWSSWCPPCRQEAPVLAEVYLEYENLPVEFVGVDIWDVPAAAQEHIDRYNVPYPNGIDADGIIAINYGVTGLPEKFFISPEGMVVKKFVGPMSPSKLRGILNEMLGPRSSLPSQ